MEKIYSLPHLTPEFVKKSSQSMLESIDQEYPYAPHHVVTSKEDVKTPRKFHPAFYGCFDWHAAVLNHRALVRQLHILDEHPYEDEIRKALNEHLAADKILTEAGYFKRKQSMDFERPYGWAWLLRLARELHEWDDADANSWAKNLQPLEKIIVKLIKKRLPEQRNPIREGTHDNTAFAMTHFLDYARIKNNKELEKLVVQRSKDWFLGDRDYPVAYEPSGEDFLSPCLEEADLMRRVLPKDDFVEWLNTFLPDPAGRSFQVLRQPVKISDSPDPKDSHLLGLNLSRAWCLSGIASALPMSYPNRVIFLESAVRHTNVGLQPVFRKDYMVKHWLASFAIYPLSQTID